MFSSVQHRLMVVNGTKDPIRIFAARANRETVSYFHMRYYAAEKVWLTSEDPFRSC